MGLHLGKLPLTTEWQPYTPSIMCKSVEWTGTKGWSWCTSIESGAIRAVGALVREPIIQNSRNIAQGETLLFFKGDEEGEIYEKCTY